MYDLCRDKCHLTAERERIVRLMMSFNEPIVAPAGHHAQPTPAYICIMREEEGFSVHIYLYLTIEKVGLLYSYPDKILNSDECKEAEEEAIQFVEQMGCLMDDLHFSSLLSEEQDKLLATIPLFSSAVPKAPEENLRNESDIAKPEVLNKTAADVIEKAGVIRDMSANKSTRDTVVKEQQSVKPRISSTVSMKAHEEKLYNKSDVIKARCPDELVHEPGSSVSAEKNTMSGEKTKGVSSDGKEAGETTIFLSKFRRRAMADKDDTGEAERLGRLMATI